MMLKKLFIVMMIILVGFLLIQLTIGFFYLQDVINKLEKCNQIDYIEHTNYPPDVATVIISKPISRPIFLLLIKQKRLVIETNRDGYIIKVTLEDDIPTKLELLMRKSRKKSKPPSPLPTIPFPSDSTKIHSPVKTKQFETKIDTINLDSFFNRIEKNP